MSKNLINPRKGSSKRGSLFHSYHQFEKKEFDSRKQDHLVLSMDKKVQYNGKKFLDSVYLKTTAFPEIDFETVTIEQVFLNKVLSAPFFISSMTAGHKKGLEINKNLAFLSQEKQILMGVGSQRKELMAYEAAKEWEKIRKWYPNCLLLSNIGLSQLISSPVDKIEQLVESSASLGLIIHTNPLQECIQFEGTPQFKGGLKAIERICRRLKVPVIIKEVGFGFSKEDLKRLGEAGVYAVDFAGTGGTNWSVLEGLRNKKFPNIGIVFSNTGYSFKEWLEFKNESNAAPFELWASGGVRSGLDVAKMIAMGATLVGLAQPWLKTIVEADEKKNNRQKALLAKYDEMVYELKTALFICGSGTTVELRDKKAFYVETK